MSTATLEPVVAGAIARLLGSRPAAFAPPAAFLPRAGGYDQLADAAALLDALVDLLHLPARDPRRGVAGTAPLAHTRRR